MRTASVAVAASPPPARTARDRILARWNSLVSLTRPARSEEAAAMSFPSGFETMMRAAVLEALATEEAQEALAEAGATVADATEVLVSHPTLGEATISLTAPTVVTADGGDTTTPDTTAPAADGP